VPALDDAELQRLRRDASEAAAAEGLCEGRRQGLAEGHAQGYATGLAAGQAEAAARAEQLGRLAQAFPQALRRAEDEVAQALVALALDVARQLVHRSWRAEPQWIVAVVRDLLHQEPPLHGEPRLLLHPDDAALVRDALAGELESAGWQVRPDEAISRGGCLVQAGTGAQDATMETRWARIEAALGAAERCA
jgi:flagellar assembly protein FliH